MSYKYILYILCLLFIVIEKKGIQKNYWGKQVKKKYSVTIVCRMNANPNNKMKPK